MGLYCKETGNPDGPVILFLHGGGVSGWMWDKQVDFFADYRVLVPDLESHGRSSEEPFISIQESARKVVELAEAKAPDKKAIIIGLSLGAQILVEILSTRPDIVSCAIINSALVRPMPWTRKMIRPVFKMSYGLIQNKSFARLQARQLYIGDEYFESYFADSKKTALPDLIRVIDSNMSYSLPESFQNARVRTMVLVGAREKGVMLKSARDMLKSNPSCKGCFVPGIGHGVSLADPILFNEIAKAWIENGNQPEGVVPIA